MVNNSTFEFYDDDDDHGGGGGGDDDGGGGSVSSTEEELNRIWDKLQADAVKSQRRQNDHHAGGDGNTSMMNNRLEDCNIDGINRECDQDNLNISSTDTEKCPPATETPSSPPSCHDSYPNSYPSDLQENENNNRTRATVDQMSQVHHEIVPKRSIATTQSTPTRHQHNYRTKQELERIPTLTSELPPSNKNGSDSKNETQGHILKNPYLSSSKKSPSSLSSSSSSSSSSGPSLPSKTSTSTRTIQPKVRKVEHQNQNRIVKTSNHFKNHPASPLLVTSKKTLTKEQKYDEKNKKYHQHETDDDDDARSDDISTSSSDSGSSSSIDSSSSDDDASNSSSSSSSVRDTDMFMPMKKKNAVTTKRAETVDLTTTDSDAGATKTKENQGRRAEASSSSNRKVLDRTPPSKGLDNVVTQTTQRPILRGPKQLVQMASSATAETTVRTKNAANDGTTTNMTTGRKTHSENNSTKNQTMRNSTASASFNSKLNTTGTKDGATNGKASKNRTEPPDSSHRGPSHTQKDSGDQPRVLGGNLDMENTNKLPSPPVHEYQNPLEMIGSIQEAEIDTALAAPPIYRERPMPVLRRFNSQDHPPEYRETVAVSDLFGEPMSLLWKSQYDRFNPCQTEVSRVLSWTDNNVLISAPTGAGKTGKSESRTIFLLPLH